MAQAQPKSKTDAACSRLALRAEAVPLGPAFGCEITGIRLAEGCLDATMFDKVYEAFLDYQLILFRDVDLPPARQVAFARRFGEVQIHS